MSPLDVGLLAGAGLLAGVVNAIAGGGTFFSFAALTAVGIPPVAASATSATSMLPGQIASTLAYRRELVALRTVLLPLAVVSAMGGLAGGWLLLHLASATFRTLMPWLLLGADFHAANAGKDILTVVMQGFAVVLFLLFGIVHWPEAAVVAASGVVNGRFGVAVARFVPLPAIRGAVLLTDLALTFWYVVR